MMPGYKSLAVLLGAGLLLAVSAEAQLFGKGDPAPESVLRIGSKPEGARVFVDRIERGRTPVEVENLAAGAHLVTMELDDHLEWLGTVSVEAGERRELSATLEPVTGTALVVSEPEGAQVSIDGAVRGTTPLLLRDLPLGGSRVVLSCPGFQDYAMDLDVKSATPQKLRAVLVTDSASLRVESEPAGALLKINGVPRGNTPVLIERIPDGDSEIELSLDGYADYSQNMRLSAGAVEEVRVTLQPLPATLNLHSIPAGARVYVDNSYRGEAPLKLENLPPKSYRVRVELPAHDIMARDVNLTRGENKVEEFRLTANCGALRVVTVPSGVTILVDGKVSGTTAAAEDATDQISDPLTVPLVPVGEREVTFTRQGYHEQKRKVNIARDRTETLEVTLKRRFIPDYEVRTASNVYRGVLINITPEFVRLETEMGVIRAFPVEDIKSRRPLRVHETTEVGPGTGD